MVGGGIPDNHSVVELRLTFKDGGAFDFHSTFEQIKERVHQAYSVARESGGQGAGSVDLASVHLEQLPAYEAASEAPRAPEGPVIHSPIPVRRGSVVPAPAVLASVPQGAPSAPPNEPPQGYEEAQAQLPGELARDR